MEKERGDFRERVRRAVLVGVTIVVGGSLGWTQGCADECTTNEDCNRGQEVCENGECVASTYRPPPPPNDAGPKPDATPDAGVSADAEVFPDAVVVPDVGFSPEAFPPRARFEVTDIRDDVVPLFIAEADFVAPGSATANVVRRTFTNDDGDRCELRQVTVLTGTTAPLSAASFRVRGLNGYPDPLTLSQTATAGIFNAVDQVAVTHMAGNPIFTLGRMVTFEIASDNVPGHFDDFAISLLPPPMLFGENDTSEYAYIDDHEGWVWTLNPIWSSRTVIVEAFTWPVRDTVLTCTFPEARGQFGGKVPIEAAAWFNAYRGFRIAVVEVRRDSVQTVAVPLVGGGTLDVSFRLSTAQRRAANY
ncbi:MAG: hypothetical protein HY791_19845 [Deltaproteobacteria bacterium]|nr:hypothetical protein [Deltaproteobacteria bacterium]